MPSVGALHVQPAPLAPRVASRELRPAPSAPANTLRVALAVESIGYLVPRIEFIGRVHSAFAQACNLVCDDELLTIAASAIGDGPATLRLARRAPTDLRELFDVGERIDCRQGVVRTRRAQLRLLQARVWCPAEPGPSLGRARIEAHLRNAQTCLAQRRGSAPSVIDGAAAALGEACRALDRERAVRHVDHLVGWGEGLTPAGDDFLVGLLAGLDALLDGVEARRQFRSALAAAVAARTSRTTPVAAHYLRLAGARHYSAPLVDLRAALLCEDDPDVVEVALAATLAIGATSGADTVAGLLAGLNAWLPARSALAAA